MKRFIKIVVMAFILCASVSVSKDVQAKTTFKNISGKYEFDTELYYSKNGSSPIKDFGTQFRTFTPYLKITKNKKIEYYFSFEGGRGTCKLKNSTLTTIINNPNSGIVKKKMKVKKIKGIQYIVQTMYGKKIYWEKKTKSGKIVTHKNQYIYIKSSVYDKSVPADVTYDNNNKLSVAAFYGKIATTATKAKSLKVKKYKKMKLLTNKSKCIVETRENGKVNTTSLKHYLEHNIDNSVILTMRGAVSKIFVKNGKVIKIIRITEK